MSQNQKKKQQCCPGGVQCHPSCCEDDSFQSFPSFTSLIEEIPVPDGISLADFGDEAISASAPASYEDCRDNTEEEERLLSQGVRHLEKMYPDRAPESSMCFLEANGEQPLDAITGGHSLHIQTTIDSGACENVMNSKTVPFVETRESAGSKRGQTYSSANGSVMKNEGEKEIAFSTNDGATGKTVWQIADVTKPLRSVALICDQGHSVHFFAGGGYIENGNTKQRMRFKRQGNQYIHDEYISKGSGFPRQST